MMNLKYSLAWQGIHLGETFHATTDPPLTILRGLEHDGLAERTTGGWRLTVEAERRNGWALRELDGWLRGFPGRPPRPPVRRYGLARRWREMVCREGVRTLGLWAARDGLA